MQRRVGGSTRYAAYRGSSPLKYAVVERRETSAGAASDESGISTGAYDGATGEYDCDHGDYDGDTGYFGSARSTYLENAHT